MSFPVKIKKNVQKSPNREQYFIVLRVKLLILGVLLSDFAFETSGSSIFETAQVIVVGNRMKGIAIAVSIPYTLMDWEGLRPYTPRKRGIALASRLWIRLKDMFVIEIGKDMVAKFFIFFCILKCLYVFGSCLLFDKLKYSAHIE